MSVEMESEKMRSMRSPHNPQEQEQEEQGGESCLSLSVLSLCWGITTCPDFLVRETEMVENGHLDGWQHLGPSNTTLKSSMLCFFLLFLFVALFSFPIPFALVLSALFLLSRFFSSAFFFCLFAVRVFSFVLCVAADTKSTALCALLLCLFSCLCLKRAK